MCNSWVVLRAQDFFLIDALWRWDISSEAIFSEPTLATLRQDDPSFPTFIPMDDICECVADRMRRWIQEFDGLLEATNDQQVFQNGNGVVPSPIGGTDDPNAGFPVVMAALLGGLFLAMLYMAQPRTARGDIEPPRKPRRDNPEDDDGPGGNHRQDDLIM